MKYCEFRHQIYIAGNYVKNDLNWNLSEKWNISKLKFVLTLISSTKLPRPTCSSKYLNNISNEILTILIVNEWWTKIFATNENPLDLKKISISKRCLHNFQQIQLEWNHNWYNLTWFAGWILICSFLWSIWAVSSVLSLFCKTEYEWDPEFCQKLCDCNDIQFSYKTEKPSKDIEISNNKWRSFSVY